MNEAEARALAREIMGTPRWEFAYAEEQPFGNRDWWVKAHHDAMKQHPGASRSPYPVAIMTSREDWEAERAKWGKL